MSNLKAIKREISSSGSNNKLRSEGLIPAILYGGKSPNLKLSTSLPKVVKNSDIILLCIKAQSLYSFLGDNYKFFQVHQIFL